ncbi:hypothetical protein EDB80DRAFT_699497 [Ilyonectria destructans]|nr:hypothetical protein EDB80DRAFT_699497 [Ilyonectria destructans]
MQLQLFDGPGHFHGDLVLVLVLTLTLGKGLSRPVEGLAQVRPERPDGFSRDGMAATWRREAKTNGGDSRRHRGKDGRIDSRSRKLLRTRADQ